MALTVKATQVAHGADWDQTTIIELEIDELDVQISELERIRAKRDHYQLMFDAQQERVIDLMEQRAEKSHISALDGGRQATVVYGENVVYDEDAIVEALPPALLEKVTTTRIDRKKLETMVLAGVVDAQLVADNATIKPRKPFVKISEHRESEPAE